MSRGPLSRLLLVAACGFAAGGAAARPVEPWADPKLPVTRGLGLWLDAARLTAGGKPIRDGDRVDAWQDASGHGLHLSQPDAAARPIFHDADGYRAVRFDGERTFLANDKAGKSFDDLTVFVVTAPFTHTGQFPA